MQQPNNVQQIPGQAIAPAVQSAHKIQMIGPFRVPYGYEIWANGVWRVTDPITDDQEQPGLERIPSPGRKASLMRLSDRPLWIEGFSKSLDTKEELVCLGFRTTQGDEDTTVWVSRAELANRRQLETLARVGLPVRTGNAAELETYLARAIGENGPQLDWQISAARCGMYQRDDSTGFLIGKDWIGRKPAVVMDPRNDNDLHDGFRASGDLGAWVDKFVEIAGKNATTSFLCHATFVAPIMRLIRQRSFVLHHWGMTSGGKCLGAGSLVNTAGGLVRIEDLDRDFPEGFTHGYRHMPYLWDGKVATRASAFYKEHQAEALRVTYTNGISFVCTPEHPLMTDDGWRAARDLQPGTKVKAVAPRLATKRRPIPTGELPTIELAELFGMFVADGTCTDRNNLRLTSDPEVLDLAEARLPPLVTGTRRGAENELALRGGIPMRSWFAENGLDYVRADQKTVPAWVLAAPKDIVAGFLRGYFECEGAFSDHAIEAVSASRQLVTEIALLLQGLGIASTISEKRVKGYEQSYWRLQIFGAYRALRFARRIGVLTQERQRQLGATTVAHLRHARGECNLPKWVEIASIEPAEAQTVYDFTVPETHQFAANGSLNHNTAILRFGMSAWGHPIDLTSSFNSTAIGAVEIFRYIDNLPIAYDELQASTNKDHSMLIYHMVQEKGRRRARSHGGLEMETNTWRTIIRTTGEEPIIGSGKIDLGGQKKRVLEVNSVALTSNDARDLHHWMENGHYGLAGRAFLSHLVDAINADPEFVVRLYEKYRLYSRAIGDAAPGIDERSDAFAAIVLAGRLFGAWILKADPDAYADRLLTEAIAVANGTVADEDPEDIVTKALGVLRDHFTANPSRWINLDDFTDRGRLDSKGYDGLMGVVAPTNGPEGEIWLIPGRANDLLTRAGIPHRRVWTDLRKEGAMRPSGEKRPFGESAQGKRWRSCHIIKLPRLLPA